MTKYGGNVKNAKKISICNVVDNVDFNIELDEVCLPGLQRLMGIFLKIYTNVFERSGIVLDSLIIEDAGLYRVFFIGVTCSVHAMLAECLAGNVFL